MLSRRVDCCVKRLVLPNLERIKVEHLQLRSISDGQEKVHESLVLPNSLVKETQIS